MWGYVNLVSGLEAFGSRPGFVTTVIQLLNLVVT